MNESSPIVSWQRRLAAWLVHLFTASGAVFGLLTLAAIHNHKFITAFWLMGVAVVIDSIDGLFARLVQTKVAVPKIDGALMDNIVDYVNYVVAPAFLLIVCNIMPFGWGVFAGCAMLLASAFQFSHTEAKTPDHFFKGFPSYWNILVLYLFILKMAPVVNLVIVFFLAIMAFVPIKYIYPSRPGNITGKIWLRWIVVIACILWGWSAGILLFIYPETNRFLMAYSAVFFAAYFLVSLYRTFIPLQNRQGS